MTLRSMADTLGDDLSHAHDQSLEALRTGRRRAAEAKALRTGRRRVADAIDSAASRVHAGGKHVSHAARTTGDRLEASASWVRDATGRSVLQDLGRMVKAHPVRTLIGAVAIGFLAGRMLRAR